MPRPREGDRHVVERTFTTEDVESFADLSGDDQARHVEADSEGRVMVQGLLTATLPTEIGGELEVLARRMTFEFRRPVYTGDTVTCETVVESVDESEDRYELTVSATCTNDNDEVVMVADVAGLVWKDG